MKPINSENEPEANDYHIPLDEALTYLDSFMNDINCHTKSSGVIRKYSYDSIETLSKTDIFVDTKSDTFSGVEMEPLNRKIEKTTWTMQIAIHSAIIPKNHYLHILGAINI